MTGLEECFQTDRAFLSSTERVDRIHESVGRSVSVNHCVVADSSSDRHFRVAFSFAGAATSLHGMSENYIRVFGGKRSPAGMASVGFSTLPKFRPSLR